MNIQWTQANPSNTPFQLQPPSLDPCTSMMDPLCWFNSGRVAKPINLTSTGGKPNKTFCISWNTVCDFLVFFSGEIANGAVILCSKKVTLQNMMDIKVITVGWHVFIATLWKQCHIVGQKVKHPPNTCTSGSKQRMQHPAKIVHQFNSRWETPFKRMFVYSSTLNFSPPTTLRETTCHDMYPIKSCAYHSPSIRVPYRTLAPIVSLTLWPVLQAERIGSDQWVWTNWQETTLNNWSWLIFESYCVSNGPTARGYTVINNQQYWQTVTASGKNMCHDKERYQSCLLLHLEKIQQLSISQGLHYCHELCYKKKHLHDGWYSLPSTNIWTWYMHIYIYTLLLI